MLGGAAVGEPKEMIASSTEGSELDFLTRINAASFATGHIKKKGPSLDLIIHSH